MGTINHDAIVITSWKPELVASAVAKATALGLQVLGPSTPVTNSFSSCLICPDGSKEGWPESNDYDAKW
jgi:hypothetical protein